METRVCGLRFVLCFNLIVLGNLVCGMCSVITVALDGTANCKTVQEAIDAIPLCNSIRILPGIYKQPVYVPKTKNFITLAGLRPEDTVLTWNNTATKIDHHQDDMDHFADVGSLDDNVESFLSHDAGEGRDLYGTIKQAPNELRKETSKSFSFSEFGSIRTRGKVTCCHFSSDGSLLATAGHDKKAVLWKMDTLKTESTSEEHQAVITDIRFRPNSSQLATTSYDKSVRLWDAANPSYCLQAYTGHSSPIMSLDFHPKKTDLFCFCDEKNEIRYWNVSPFACTHVSKGGANTQVRFQPRIGKMLAAASDKMVSIYDVETDRQTHSFQTITSSDAKKGDLLVADVNT